MVRGKELIRKGKENLEKILEKDEQKKKEREEIKAKLNYYADKFNQNTAILPALNNNENIEIVIVDDEQINRERLREIIKAFFDIVGNKEERSREYNINFKITEFDNPTAAFGYIQNNENTPPIIFIDAKLEEEDEYAQEYSGTKLMKAISQYLADEKPDKSISIFAHSGIGTRPLNNQIGIHYNRAPINVVSLKDIIDIYNKLLVGINNYIMNKNGTTDLLTTLPKSDFIKAIIRNEFITYRTSELNKNTGFGVFMIDLNDFKKVNDLYGHSTGDKILRTIGEYLKRKNNERCFIGRYGGDELIGIIKEPNEEQVKEVLTSFAEDIRKLTVKAYIFENNVRVPVNVSVGTSIGFAYLKPNEYDNIIRTLESSGVTDMKIELLMKLADMGTYGAKELKKKEGFNGFNDKNMLNENNIELLLLENKKEYFLITPQKINQ